METLTHDVGLQMWRDARPSLQANHRVFFQNIIEELLEPLYTKVTVKEMTQEILEKYYPEILGLTSDSVVLDSICDIQVFSINEVELMGYDNNKCMNETVKEISSRQQDPAQKEIWEKWGYDGCKWKKDPKQEPDTLYEADYYSCAKIEKETK
jgi:hypothetical protein